MLDLARYELAVADARTQPWEKTPAPKAEDGIGEQVRRSPAVSLIRCKYDVRPLLNHDDAIEVPEKRDLFLAIVYPRAASTHRVFEIDNRLAGLLSGLTDWQPAGGLSGALDQLVELELVEGR